MRKVAAEVRRVKNADELEHPGDFYYTGPNGWTSVKTIVLACPYCNMPSAHPRARIENDEHDPLTMSDTLVCAYSQAHRFQIQGGKITSLF